MSDLFKGFANSAAFRGARTEARKAVASMFKARRIEKLDECQKCGGRTEHICSWVCVDYCPKCHGRVL